MSEALTITSPLTEGQAVLDAQNHLAEHNIFHADYLRAERDGVFGEATGRACKRAKFWLGYATKDLRATYGETLEALLIGSRPIEGAYAIRREARLAAARDKPLGVKALAEAKRYLGVKESPPNSNKVLFSDWYGMRGPWCAMFLTYCYVATGSTAFVRGRRYAYVPYIVADARAGRNGLSLTHDPKPGDAVCYDWQGDGVHDHTGLFEAWIPGGEGSEFHAVEGNTALGNDSNGGEVMRRQRDRGGRPLFVRVGR